MTSVSQLIRSKCAVIAIPLGVDLSTAGAIM